MPLTNVDRSLRCSFCHKGQGPNRKLISTPDSDPGRAYICDECIAICAAIVEDDRGELNSEPSGESNALLSHPLAPELLTSVERWIKQESRGADAGNELAEMRSIAIRLFAADKE
jgi:hypothetical protein